MTWVVSARRTLKQFPSHCITLIAISKKESIEKAKAIFKKDNPETRYYKYISYVHASKPKTGKEKSHGY